MKPETEAWLVAQSGGDREAWLKRHNAHLARKAARIAIRDAATHYIYTLSHPTRGVYVGCTSAPEQRCLQHFVQGHGSPTWCDLLVHDAMRETGAASWKFRIVAVAPGYHAGRKLEDELIAQFRAAGSPVFNGIRRQQPGETVVQARERRRAIIEAARVSRRDAKRVRHDLRKAG